MQIKTYEAKVGIEMIKIHKLQHEASLPPPPARPSRANALAACFHRTEKSSLMKSTQNKGTIFRREMNNQINRLRHSPLVKNGGSEYSFLSCQLIKSAIRSFYIQVDDSV
jgi:hypothetical protein